jgi:hypothetical protein
MLGSPCLVESADEIHNSFLTNRIKLFTGNKQQLTWAENNKEHMATTLTVDPPIRQH